jgi:hypothetical protein
VVVTVPLESEPVRQFVAGLLGSELVRRFVAVWLGSEAAHGSASFDFRAPAKCG